MVSVRVITYNHEAFLRQCLEGIFMQQTDFPFEVVIGEDCSTDGTRVICEEYRTRYPEVVTLLMHQQNVGAQENARRTREACKGKYIALCEGDDYWTDPLKLQKQATFLEENGEFTLCFHNCYVRHETAPSETQELFQHYSKDIYGIQDLFGKWLIPTASVMFRNHLFEDYPDWLRNAIVGDTPFYILIASFGKIKLLPGVMGVYRRHPGGATNFLHGYHYWERMIELYTGMDEYFEFRYRNEINPVLEWFHYKLAQIAFKKHDYEKYKLYARRCVRRDRKLLLQYRYLGMYMASYAPALFKVYSRIKSSSVQ